MILFESIACTLIILKMFGLIEITWLAAFSPVFIAFVLILILAIIQASIEN